MASPKITTVEGLKAYALRKLGAGAINIEITPEQLQDCVDDTLDDYLPVAYSGVQERYIPLQLIAGTQQYILPYETFAVTEINSVNLMGIGSGIASNMFSMSQFIAADIYKPGIAKIDLMGYYSINSMIETTNLIFSSKFTFDYNSISKVLTIFGNIVEGSNDKVILKCFNKLDLEGTPDTNNEGRYAEENIYNERWVKRMTTARAMLQWGRNIGGKYTNVPLPGGGSLNGQGIISEAKEDIEKLYAELESDFAMPADFFIG